MLKVYFCKRSGQSLLPRNNNCAQGVGQGMNFSGKNVLVVGASGGLGKEFTSVLIAGGANVYGTATSNESAANISDQVVQKLLLNLESAESIATLANYLNSAVKLDGVIVSAGLVAFGLAVETPAEIDARLLQVNYRGPRDLLVALQPNLAAAESAFVLNVTGVVAQMPLPSMSSYSASKMAMHGFLTAVSREWRRSGIKVVSELLGHTETGLATRAIVGQAPQFPQGLSPADAVSQMLASLDS
jgi:cyclic-di-GMP-binding biofilm dispersal mediator protein